ncbi:MAG: hypothetical protein P8H90_01830 [Tateyamaria sp.]|nr:hypothetical protein [Tateyamaria sp.]
MSKKSVLYKNFWTTEVGIAMDDAFFSVVRTSYEILSFGLGQAVAFLVPTNEI